MMALPPPGSMHRPSCYGNVSVCGFGVCSVEPAWCRSVWFCFPSGSGIVWGLGSWHVMLLSSSVWCPGEDVVSVVYSASSGPQQRPTL